MWAAAWLIVFAVCQCVNSDSQIVVSKGGQSSSTSCLLISFKRLSMSWCPVEKDARFHKAFCTLDQSRYPWCLLEDHPSIYLGVVQDSTRLSPAFYPSGWLFRVSCLDIHGWYYSKFVCLYIVHRYLQYEIHRLDHSDHKATPMNLCCANKWWLLSSVRVSSYAVWSLQSTVMPMYLRCTMLEGSALYIFFNPA